MKVCIAVNANMFENCEDFFLFLKIQPENNGIDRQHVLFYSFTTDDGNRR